MNDSLFEELLALRLKRPLGPDERACLERWLAAHPADRRRWAEETALADALQRRPEPPVPSNFMARVWQGIEAEERHASRRESGWHTWLRWPSLAQQFALAVMLVAAVMVFQGRRARSPAQVARSLEQVGTLASLPNVALLKDFEAIRRLNQTAADVELLAAFERER
jgi:anti-sigma factor RsiW